MCRRQDSASADWVTKGVAGEPSRLSWGYRSAWGLWGPAGDGRYRVGAENSSFGRTRLHGRISGPKVTDPGGWVRARELDMRGQAARSEWCIATW